MMNIDERILMDGRKTGADWGGLVQAWRSLHNDIHQFAGNDDHLRDVLAEDGIGVAQHAHRLVGVERERLRGVPRVEERLLSVARALQRRALEAEDLLLRHEPAVRGGRLRRRLLGDELRLASRDLHRPGQRTRRYRALSKGVGAPCEPVRCAPE